MVSVQPRSFSLAKQGSVHKLLLNRAQSDVLKFEKTLVPEVVRCIGVTHNNDILDADSKPTVRVIAGLYTKE